MAKFWLFLLLALLVGVVVIRAEMYDNSESCPIDLRPEDLKCYVGFNGTDYDDDADDTCFEFDHDCINKKAQAALPATEETSYFGNWTITWKTMKKAIISGFLIGAFNAIIDMTREPSPPVSSSS